MTTASTNTTGTPLIEVADLRVHLPIGSHSEVAAVRGVSITIDRGERVGIVGESGSGKTVTARAVAGLLPESPRVRVDGSIRIAGREMVGAPDRQWSEVRRKTAGMIFQDPLTYLNPTMKVGAQVRESLSPTRRRDRALDTKAHEYLSMAGLDRPDQVAQQFPHELSGGMRQRVLIALAIAKEPDVLVADEPTTALDATVQQRVLDTLSGTVAKLGTSLMLISHDIAVVANMTDRIYVMYRGHIVEHGLTRDVLDRPQHPYTQALLRSVRSLAQDGVELYAIPYSLRRTLAEQEEQHDT